MKTLWGKGTGYGMVPFLRWKKPSEPQLLLGAQCANIGAYNACVYIREVRGG